MIAAGGGRYQYVSESVLVILCNAPFLAINLFSIHRILPCYKLLFLFSVCVENAVSFCALTKQKSTLPDCHRPCGKKKKSSGINVNKACMTLPAMCLM